MKEAQNLRQQEEEQMGEENVDYEQLANTRAELLKAENEAEQLRPAATEAPVTDEDLAKVIELWTGIPASQGAGERAFPAGRSGGSAEGKNRGSG